MNQIPFAHSRCLLPLFLLLSLAVSGCSENTPQIPEATPPPPSVEVEETLEEIPTPPEKIYVNHREEGGEFDLPLYGASGYAGATISLFDEIGGTAIKTLTSGDGFYILQEEGAYWEIVAGDVTGWVKHSECLINLPDILPSIIYENPYATICYSCSLGKDIPNVTGHRLYEALCFNERLGEEEFLTLALYETAKKLNIAQQMAVADGNSLLIYECYRPYTVQTRLVDGLAQLMGEDAEVNRSLTTSPWSKTWFVSTGISNHQRGRSADLTLVKVDEFEIKTTGDYAYTSVLAYTEHEMPTQFDELSPLAATFTGPVSTSGDAWKSATLSSSMTESAILLQKYCTDAGLIPLASEWWHFDDTSGGGSGIIGDFTATGSFGTIPLLTETNEALPSLEE